MSHEDLRDCIDPIRTPAERQISALTAEVKALRTEVDETNQLFEAQHRRTVEADKLWREATGKHNVMPDLGTLIQWLLDRAATIKRENEALRRALNQVIIIGHADAGPCDRLYCADAVLALKCSECVAREALDAASKEQG